MVKGVVFAIVITATIWVLVEASSAPFDLPAYPGAEEVDSYSVGSTCIEQTLATTASPAVIATFYRSTMTQAGWEMVGDARDRGSGSSGLSFERSTLFERYSASITIWPPGSVDTTTTRISLSARISNESDTCKRSMLLGPK